jgi:hypothetical protein
MAAHKVEEESYWPGYVDAIINVVLNILFLVAVFTVALSTVDFAPPKPVQAAVAPAIAQTAAQLPVRPQPVPVTLVVIPEHPYKPSALSQPEQTAVTWKSRTLEQGGALLSVDFEDSAADIPPPKSRALSTALRDINRDATQGQWLIWVTSDTRKTSASRLAYLRVISVRSALIEAGVSPEFIQTRILDVRDSAATPTSRVQLVLQAS